MAKKMAETEVAADFQILVQKLNGHIQQNMLMPMLMPIWPAPMA